MRGYTQSGTPAAGALFAEAASQEEEDALVAAGTKIVLRLDLLPSLNPPVQTATAAISAISSSGATLTIKFNKAGTVYYTALPAASAVPTKTALRAASSTTCLADTNKAINIAELAGLTSYAVHYFAEDSDGRTSAVLTAGPFTTLAAAASILDLPFTGADNATTFTDLSDTPKTITAQGAAKITGNQLDLTGAGAYLQTPDHANFAFGSDDRSIVIYASLAQASGTTFQQVLISKGAAGNLNASWYLMFDSNNANQGKVSFAAINNGAQIYVDSGINDTAEHKYELRTVGGTTSLYIDNVLKGSTSTAWSENAGELRIGTWGYNTTNYRWTGKINSVKITRG